MPIIWDFKIQKYHIQAAYLYDVFSNHMGNIRKLYELGRYNNRCMTVTGKTKQGQTRQDEKDCISVS